MNRYIRIHIFFSVYIRYCKETKLSVCIHLASLFDLTRSAVPHTACASKEQIRCSCIICAQETALEISFRSECVQKLCTFFRSHVFCKLLFLIHISSDKAVFCHSPRGKGQISHQLPVLRSCNDKRNLAVLFERLAHGQELIPGLRRFQSVLLENILSVYEELTVQALRKQVYISIICILEEIINCLVHFLLHANPLKFIADIHHTVNVLCCTGKRTVCTAVNIRKGIAVDIQLKLCHIICIAAYQLELRLFQSVLFTELGQNLLQNNILR